MLYIMIWISLLKKPVWNIIKFLYSVKPTQRHDDIIIIIIITIIIIIIITIIIIIF